MKKNFRLSAKTFKKISAAVLFILGSTVLLAQESILPRIFFEDFINTPKIISENPLQTSIIIGSTALLTAALIPNDRYLLKTLQQNSTNEYKTFFDVFNTCGDGMYVLAADAALFALGGEKEKHTAAKIVESIAVGGAAVYLGKVVAGRLRPTQADTQYEYKMFNFKDNSMPSGHTMVAFAWATVLADEYGIWYLTYPVAALTGAARIYKNAHWPSDVLVGAVVGVFFAKVAQYEDKDITVSYDTNGAGVSYRF